MEVVGGAGLGLAAACCVVVINVVFVGDDICVAVAVGGLGVVVVLAVVICEIFVDGIPVGVVVCAVVVGGVFVCGVIDNVNVGVVFVMEYVVGAAVGVVAGLCVAVIHVVSVGGVVVDAFGSLGIFVNFVVVIGEVIVGGVFCALSVVVVWGFIGILCRLDEVVVFCVLSAAPVCTCRFVEVNADTVITGEVFVEDVSEGVVIGVSIVVSSLVVGSVIVVADVCVFRVVDTLPKSMNEN